MTARTLSVVIPTLNGGRRLPATLGALQQQDLGDGLELEVLVVDNGSTDDTSTVVARHAASSPPGVRVRLLQEPARGAGRARRAGVHAASGELVGLVDDDIVVPREWARCAVDSLTCRPLAGAVGNRIRPYVVDADGTCRELPAWSSLVGAVDRGDEPLLYRPRDRMLPPGGALVVRRTAWLASVPDQLVLEHRGRHDGLSGEDLEAVLHLQLAGWEVWYSPVPVEHRVEPDRLRIEELLRISSAVGVCGLRLRMMRLARWQRPAATVAFLLRDGMRLLAHLVRHPGVGPDAPLLACERELLRGRFLSPLLLWRRVGTAAWSR